jgi:hypothetical protein
VGAVYVPNCNNFPVTEEQWNLFLQNNAPAHRALATQKNLAYQGFQYLDHPAHPPDLAPSGYQVFLGLKTHFSSETEVISGVDNWLDGQTSEFF